MPGNAIRNIYIRNLWNLYSLSWTDLDPHVNILVGINGSGKSTILQILSALLQDRSTMLQKYGNDLHIKVELEDGNIVSLLDNGIIQCTSLQRDFGDTVLVSTFDMPVRDKERLQQKESSLDQELDFLIYQRSREQQTNFTNYRLKATMPHYDSVKIVGRIRHFFEQIINPLFSKTGKSIAIDEQTNELVFRQNGVILSLKQLSSGEKQLLIILFRLFLMEEKRYVVLLDEPEISLHIEWQQQLIDVMLKVNPNAQFIISTHSPSIFGKGWMNKIQRIEDLKED